MKKISLFLIVMMLATASAVADWNRIEGGAVVQTWRSKPVTLGQTTYPTDAQLHAAMIFERLNEGTAPVGQYILGWQYDHVSASKAVWIPTGYADIPIAVVSEYPEPDITVPLMSGTNAVGTARLLVDADTMEVGAVTNSASPQTAWTEQVAQWKAERDARATALSELNLTQAQIDAVHDYFAVDVDVLFSSLSVNQRKFLKVQRELVRALAKRELKAVR